jgi:hypothetical protein
MPDVPPCFGFMWLMGRTHDDKTVYTTREESLLHRLLESSPSVNGRVESPVRKTVPILQRISSQTFKVSACVWLLFVDLCVAPPHTTCTLRLRSFAASPRSRLASCSVKLVHCHVRPLHVSYALCLCSRVKLKSRISL